MRLIASLSVLLCLQALPAADYVWWEGEAAASSNFSGQGFPVAWYGEKAKGLSGGDWLNNGGKRGATPIAASWQVEVPADGSYFFHGRMFWKHGPFRWRFDAGEWAECGSDRGLLDSYELATHIGANWVSLGSVELAKGPHRFEVELLAKEGDDAPGCFDCFVLSKAPFVPRGNLKPGDRFGDADTGWWAFEPSPDPFAKEALLDLRSLNESHAGQSGFVRAEGDGFVRGDGTPIRFWAVNSGHSLLELDDSSIDYFAARLAKLGVNMVRLHGGIFDTNGKDPMAVDGKKLQKLLYTVQALKKQGIYSHLSTFFPLWMQVGPHHGIPGYEQIEGGKHPFGLMFFDARMQELYKSWSKTLLTTVDPICGHSLANEPAVAIWEIINEDSLFFWTFGRKNVGASQWAELERRFAIWLKTRHGSLDAAKASWSGEGMPDDGADRMGLYDPWNLTSDGRAQGAGKDARAKDQIRFYAELQRAFFADMSAWLRKECGYRATVSASNWTTSQNATLGAIERWTYTATEVIDRHGYFGGKHEGDGSGYSVRVGHTYEDRCALLDPADLPIKYNQVAGHPNIISEIAWNKPNRFIADSMMVLSCYSALQGVDGLFAFATGNGNWDSSGGGVWTLMMPGELGMSPAAALTYRLGLVQESQPVARQVMTVDQLWTLTGNGLGEGRNADFRFAGAAQQDGGLDPLAFYVGRVDRSFAADAKGATATLAIDRTANTVTSQTGELRWDWGTGLLAVDAPASKGLSGFLAKGGARTLGPLTITSTMEYGLIWVVSLDGQPIASAKKILVQAFSEEKMFGFTAEGGRITDLGRAPINVRDVAGTVRLAGSWTGTVLDEHGYPKGKAAIAKDGGDSVLTLAKDALYTVLTR